MNLPYITNDNLPAFLTEIKPKVKPQITLKRMIIIFYHIAVTLYLYVTPLLLAILNSVLQAGEKNLFNQ